MSDPSESSDSDVEVNTHPLVKARIKYNSHARTELDTGRVVTHPNTRFNRAVASVMHGFEFRQTLASDAIRSSVSFPTSWPQQGYPQFAQPPVFAPDSCTVSPPLDFYGNPTGPTRTFPGHLPLELDQDNPNPLTPSIVLTALTSQELTGHLRTGDGRDLPPEDYIMQQRLPPRTFQYKRTPERINIWSVLCNRELRGGLKGYSGPVHIAVPVAVGPHDQAALKPSPLPQYHSMRLPIVGVAITCHKQTSKRLHILNTS